MASDAEIDLLVNASNALRDLERDLDRLINQAEASADPVLIAATLNRTLALRNLRRDLDETIRVAQAAAPPVRVDVDVDDDDAHVRTRRFNAVIGVLAHAADGAVGAIGGLSKGLAVTGAAAGTAAPLLAGLVVAVESILPAAALATSGLQTLLLVTATLKIGMNGVGDAISAAFDPETTPEELAEAMKKLGPHAQSFVKELSSMRKGLKALQIDVQNRLFANLDKSVERLGKSVLPSLHGALDRTADSLNDMAKGAAAAAADLGDRGILGTALAHSTGALAELERVPGQVVTAFGQLAAASGPALEGLATRAGSVADRIAEKLSKAFESGALEKAINVAISNIDQLFRVVGNVFSGIGNIVNALSADGQGLFGTLEKISQAFEDLTASKEFQSALQALSKTMATLVSAVLPLVAEAFKALLPVIEILAPPIQELIRHLGEELQPVIAGMAPVLEALATAFVKLIPVLTPIIDLGLQLVEAVLPILTVLFEHLGEVFERLAPLIAIVAENVAAQLEPILAELPGILEQILPQFLELADRLLPLLVDVLVDLGPELAELGLALAQLLVELTPLIVKFLEFQIFLLDKMLPIITPLANAFGKSLVGAIRLLTDFINEFLIPIIRVVVDLFQGDWSEAATGAARIIEHLRDRASAAFENMKQRMLSLAGQLLAGLVNRASQLGSQFVAQIRSLVNRAIERMAQLPIGILNVMSGLGNLLFSIGADIVQGLINGITSRIGGVVAAAAKLASSIPSTVKGLLGIHSPSTIMIGVGDDIMAGLLKGIGDSLPELRAQVTGIAAVIPQSVAQTPSAVSAGSLNFRPPSVNVYIGNERLNRHIDFRVDDSQRRNTILTAQGRRR